LKDPGRYTASGVLKQKVWSEAMLFVRLGEKEYIPFLRQDSIKLKDAKSNTLEINEDCTEMLVKDLDAELDESGAWFKCGYYALRVLLEKKVLEVAALRAKMVTNELLVDEHIQEAHA
jgi:hypothetical protein